MKYKFLTFNLGQTQKFSQEDWEHEFREKGSEWKEQLEFQTNPYAWVICTQEDTDTSSFIEVFYSTFLSSSYKRVFMTSFDKMKISPFFHVHLALFVLKKRNNNEKVINKKIVHERKLLFVRKMTSIVQYGDIMFAGAHFPMISEGNKGLLQRKVALEKVMSVFTESNAKYMFLMGDLNFRIVKIDGYDAEQLQFILNESKNQNVRDLVWENLPSVNLTCKMEPQRPENCTTTENPLKCFSNKRTPSLCDRILFVRKDGMDLNVNVSSIKTLEFGAILQSDHNALLAELDLDKTPVPQSRKVSKSSTVTPSQVKVLLEKSKQTRSLSEF